MSITDSTIAAIATPIGYGGIGIIRVSGQKVTEIIKKVLGCLLKPRYANYKKFLDRNGYTLDQGIAIYYQSPHSFTGEDVLELQGHGGPVILNTLLGEILSYGVKLAKPGEFSQRAFLNNKLDLIQAEAVSDLIYASSEQAARAAVRSYQGEFSTSINQLKENIIEIRVQIEAQIDFSEEEIDTVEQVFLMKKLKSVLSLFEKIKNAACQGKVLKEGINLVLTGPPNAGKSSLLNALARSNIAIVTPIAGTTRDIIKESIHLDGLPIHILDTAGLCKTSDVIEKEGIKRAKLAIEQADLILLVVDQSLVTKKTLLEWSSELGFDFSKLGDRLIVINNKLDLLEDIPKIEHEHEHEHEQEVTTVSLSAHTGQGVDLLKNYIQQKVGYQQTSEGIFIARQRHINALTHVQNRLTITHKLLNSQEQSRCELAAEELRYAQRYLDEVTGQFTQEDLLGKIFNNFCIGK